MFLLVIRPSYQPNVSALKSVESVHAASFDGIESILEVLGDPLGSRSIHRRAVWRMVVQHTPAKTQVIIAEAWKIQRTVHPSFTNLSRHVCGMCPLLQVTHFQVVCRRAVEFEEQRALKGLKQEENDERGW